MKAAAAASLAALAALLWLCGAAQAAAPPPDAVGYQGMSCVQGYAKAFSQLNDRASALKLREDAALKDTAAIFKGRPARCEVGGYGYYLDQLMQFARRALRSGATRTTPKEGFLRAAAAATGYGPERVPQAEYYEDVQRYRQAHAELAALVTEAGAGPLSGALLVALERAVPVAGAYGPAPAGPAQAADAAPAVSPYAAPAPAPAASALSIGAPQGVSAAPQPLNIPTVPLPDWGVEALHEMPDLIRLQRDDLAAQKLAAILRWIESQR